MSIIGCSGFWSSDSDSCYFQADISLTWFLFYGLKLPPLWSKATFPLTLMMLLGKNLYLHNSWWDPIKKMHIWGVKKPGRHTVSCRKKSLTILNMTAVLMALGSLVVQLENKRATHYGNKTRNAECLHLCQDVLGTLKQDISKYLFVLDQRTFSFLPPSQLKNRDLYGTFILCLQFKANCCCKTF